MLSPEQVHQNIMKTIMKMWKPGLAFRQIQNMQRRRHIIFIEETTNQCRGSSKNQNEIQNLTKE